MRTMTLYERPENCTNVHRNALADNIGILMSQKVRVFRTFAFSSEEETSFVFVTTHKDTHLNFGMFDHETLRHLGHLLEAEFKDYPEAQILVLKGGESDDGWLVTRTEDNSGYVVTFTFSPAQGRIS